MSGYKDVRRDAIERGIHINTMKVHSLAFLTATLFVLAGCQSPKARTPTETNAAVSTRNNCYSLLHQLLDDEKNVSLLRFIKREKEDVKNLVKRIATASGAGSKVLEGFAKKDPSIRLDDLRLPPGELSTREAIAATRQKELLSEKGDEFELSLLLTQAEALSYGVHLAKVGALNDTQPARAQAMAEMSENLQRLYQEIYALLLSKTKGR